LGSRTDLEASNVNLRCYTKPAEILQRRYMVALPYLGDDLAGKERQSRREEP